MLSNAFLCMRFISAVLSVRSYLAALALVAACLQAHAAEPLRIGQTAILSGPLRGLGQEVTARLQAHVREVNARGGIGGRQIELVQLDDGFREEQAERNVARMAGEGVVALVMPIGTPPTLGAAWNAANPLAQQYRAAPRQFQRAGTADRHLSHTPLQRAPLADGTDLGLRPGDCSSRTAAHGFGAIRPSSQPAYRAWAYGRRLAVQHLACGQPQRLGQGAQRIPGKAPTGRLLPRELPPHDLGQLPHADAGGRHDGSGSGPHPVLYRLAVRNVDHAAHWFDDASISPANRIKIGRTNAIKLFNLDL